MFLEEEGTDRAELLLRRLLDDTARTVVPSSLLSELANVFWVRRRDGLTEAAAQAFWGELFHLPLNIVEISLQLHFEALTFSFREQVSPYDATFVVLARSLECDLITADRPLWQKVQGSCPWVKLL